MLNALRISVFVTLLIPIFSFSQDSLWTQKADIPTARWHLSSVVANDKIYAIGGVNGYTRIEEYDPETNLWDIKKPMPTGRAFIGKGVVDGKIYIFGGSLVNQPALTTVEMFDPDSNAWKTKQSTPTARHGIGSCVVNGKIYLIGGSNTTTSSISTVEMYDPSADEWTVGLKEMPTARWEPECATVDGKIYAVGGFPNPSSGGSSDAVEMYDPQTNEWTIKASLPAPRGGGSVAALNGMIYYFGGSPSHGTFTNDIWVYDPSLDEWNNSGGLPFVWGMMGASVVDSTIYLMAGSKIAWPHNDNFHGLYSYKSQDPTALGIKDNGIGYNQPSEYTVDQNYPNPFNPSTTLSYQLPKTSNVELSIYNQLGQKVATLVNTIQQSGQYKVKWDAYDFPSGIYYYLIQASEFRQVRKMILVK